MANTRWLRIAVSGGSVMGVVRPAKLARRDDHLHHTTGDRAVLILDDGHGRDRCAATIGCNRECHGAPGAQKFNSKTAK